MTRYEELYACAESYGAALQQYRQTCADFGRAFVTGFRDFLGANEKQVYAVAAPGNPTFPADKVQPLAFPGAMHWEDDGSWVFRLAIDMQKATSDGKQVTVQPTFPIVEIRFRKELDKNYFEVSANGIAKVEVNTNDVSEKLKPFYEKIQRTLCEWYKELLESHIKGSKSVFGFARR